MKMPGKNVLFAGFGYNPAMDGDDVVFYGKSHNFTYQAIYRSDGSTINIEADQTTPIPQGIGNFQSFGLPDGNNLRSAFVARGSDSQEGIYSVSSGQTNLIVDLNTPIPGGGSFRDFGYPNLFEDQTVFWGQNTSFQRAIFKHDSSNGLAVIADVNTLHPSGTANFTSFSSPSVYQNLIAYYGFSSAGKGLYLFDQSNSVLHTIADTNTTVPGSTNLFTGFTGQNDIHEERIAYYGNSSNGSGIYLYDHTNQVHAVVVDSTTTIPGFQVQFIGFRDPVISKSMIAFMGFGPHDQGDGIYAEFGEGIETIIQVGQQLDGRTISKLDLESWSVDKNRLAFYAEFTNGHKGVYLADITLIQEPEEEIPLPFPALVILASLLMTLGIIKAR
ncbi:MAG: hypothetical protein D6B28_01765 [Gammaproteobacteria bacterium]|nr:MAG: hypothetical protein D6B28_01765 [Gammaproteobacteria bacterium]